VETCTSATLSTTNPTWIDPGMNPGLRGDRPATNDLSHGTAMVCVDKLISHFSHISSNTELFNFMQSPSLSLKKCYCWAGQDTNVSIMQQLSTKLYNIFLTLVWKECLQCKEVWSLFMGSIQIIQSSSELSFGFDQFEAELFTPPHAAPPNLSRPIEPALAQTLYEALVIFSKNMHHN
jgi:hypothetical protein